VSRLQSLPSRIGTAPARLDRATADQQSPRRQRDNAPWRAWYGTARWQRLRQEVLIRDAYTCQRTGLICGGKYPAPDSPTVNHKKPHRGNEALFWDIDNLETVSKAEHDAAIQREEQQSLHQRGVWD
jgi:5-methylcytosine-specific restriction endonuclease McrA